MSTPKVYVLCEQNCRWEGMTKEQILAAITQAVESHEITDVDTGFVTTIKTINGVGLKFFIGTQAAWAELSADEKEGVFAIFTNDTTGDAIKTAITALQNALTKILDGEQVVGKATNAETAKNAEKTDFTNSEWLFHDIDAEKVAVNAGETYQIITDHLVIAQATITIPPSTMTFSGVENPAFVFGDRVDLLNGSITVYTPAMRIMDGTMTLQITKKTADLATGEVGTQRYTTQNGKFYYRRIR